MKSKDVEYKYWNQFLCNFKWKVQELFYFLYNFIQLESMGNEYIKLNVMDLVI